MIMDDTSVTTTPTTHEINGVQLPDNRATPESRRRPSGEVDPMDGQRLKRKAPAQQERMRERIFHEATIVEMDFGIRDSIVKSHFGYGFYVFYPPSPNSWADAADGSTDLVAAHRAQRHGRRHKTATSARPPRHGLQKPATPLDPDR